MRRTWSDKQLKVAYQEARSIRQILQLLSLSPTGANYKNIKKHLRRLGLDVDLPGKSWRKSSSKPVTVARPLKEILTKKSNYQSSKLRKRLIKEKVFKHVCSNCKLTEWFDKPIPLELDHINGINTDNRLENLRLLCPNCHAMTPTYRGKNKRGRDGTVDMIDSKSIAKRRVGSTPTDPTNEK